MTVDVAGIDRWRGGWIIARGPNGDRLTLDVAPTVRDALAATVDSAVVAVDMPMALPIDGQREAETLLRRRLGSAGRSVFISPTRHAIEAPDQAEATRRNRALDGPGISAQAWGLAGSIRELRSDLPSDPARDRWFETHPETAFAEMAQGTPLASKRSGLGVGQRLTLLRAWCPIDELLLTAPPRVPVDDVLDALAAWWSADRIRRDAALVIGPPGRDDQGFEMAIRI